MRSPIASRRRSTAKAGFAVACSLGLALVGCGGGSIDAAGGEGAGDDGVVTETTTITGDGAEAGPNPTTAPETTTVTTTPGGGNGRAWDGGDGDGGANCGVDEDAAILDESIAKVDGPASGDYWDLVETNYDPCGELTYALYQQMPQGNSQFATKILMFHDGDYLGVDSTKPQQGQIVGEGDGWFEVKYKDWEALMESGEPNAAAPKYTRTLTFEWNDSAGKVDVDGEFPNTGL